jgi:hypothetical protein
MSGLNREDENNLKTFKIEGFIIEAVSGQKYCLYLNNRNNPREAWIKR